MDEDFNYAIQELQFVLEDLQQLQEDLHQEVYGDEEHKQELLRRLRELQRRNRSIIRDLIEMLLH